MAMPSRSAKRFLADWGRSGRGERRADGKAFNQLETMVADGRVSAIYLYDLSRLGRSTETLLRFVTLCGNADVVLRCARGLSLTSQDVRRGVLVFTIMSVLYEFIAEQASERASSEWRSSSEKGSSWDRRHTGIAGRAGSSSSIPS